MCLYQVPGTVLSQVKYIKVLRYDGKPENLGSDSSLLGNPKVRICADVYDVLEIGQLSDKLMLQLSN